MRLSAEPYLNPMMLQVRIKEMAIRINAEYKGQRVLVLPVLKGAAMFAADLMREFEFDVEVDYIGVRSYEQTESNGNPEFTLFPEQSLEGRHVLVVEDIIDSGLTAEAVKQRIEAQNPASLKFVSLLKKMQRGIRSRDQRFTPDYVVFSLDSTQFVVGYGLDYEQRYRQLPAIYMLEED